jgi:hypothetical protein
MTKISKQTLRRILWLGVLNFLLFAVSSAFLGGNALSGYVELGHYYLAGRGHLTEVSRTVWICSRVHALTNLLSFPLTCWASIVLSIRKVVGEEG